MKAGELIFLLFGAPALPSIVDYIVLDLMNTISLVINLKVRARLVTSINSRANTISLLCIERVKTSLDRNIKSTKE